MTISFDLDDTLIPGRNRFPLEKVGIWHRLFSRERLRQGTVPLFRELKKRGCKVCVYTSSYRSAAAIRKLFLSHGIYLNKVINKPRHNRELGSRAHGMSKYPPAFGIDWHVDDAEGLRLEGERLGFRVLIVEGNDEDWTGKVLQLLEC